MDDEDGRFRKQDRQCHHAVQLTAFANPYAERLIGSIRRECLNHYIILNARHLKRTLSSYFRYYHKLRTHLSLGKQCPFPREALTVGKIVAIPQLGGLHHRYERIAA